MSRKRRSPGGKHPTANRISLKVDANIGSPAAEDDDFFLRECFKVTGHFEAAASLDSPRFLILGRTGSGKTALLNHIQDEYKLTLEIDPAALSLQYISNSDILIFLNKLDVKLDLFFQLLWRHVIAVELIKFRYNIKSEKDQDRELNRIFTNENKRKAIEYLSDYSDKFWLETDQRVIEITKNFEKKLRDALGGDITVLSGTMEDISTIGEQEKSEIIRRAKKVVDSVQIARLGEIIDILDDELYTDDKYAVWITIDDLDSGFAEETIRYHLIRGLIETVKNLRKVRRAKIVISLRDDLLEVVFNETRDAGFQEENMMGTSPA